MTTISFNIWDVASIDRAMQQLGDYEDSLNSKAQELCQRLAEKGLWYAQWNFEGLEWTYSGDAEYKLDVEHVDENHYAITADGEAVLFLEFGAGVKLGYGHPKAAEMGMGPGTYPGKGHWDDPHGWWYVDEDGKHHTYGNAPGMPMYNAAQDIRNEILQVAQEVFGTND